MEQTKSFSDFNIKVTRFVGKKIDIEDVLDTEILVSDYKIEPSIYTDKKSGNGLRLVLQIEHEGKERVIFTGSIILQDQCKEIEERGWEPFRTKIIGLKPRGFKFT